jgi:hypothetical protein
MKMEVLMHSVIQVRKSHSAIDYIHSTRYLVLIHVKMRLCSMLGAMLAVAEPAVTTLDVVAERYTFLTLA